MEIKKTFLQLFYDLYTKGEMLKAEKLLNNCIPLELQDDEDILNIRKEVIERLNDIRDWNNNGRPTPNDYAKIYDINLFPKFTKALEKIEEYFENNHIDGYKEILDVGCYTAGFINYLAQNGYKCVGIDIHKDLMIKLNGETHGDPLFIYSRVENISQYFDQKFHVVTAFDVLEHCLDVGPAVSAIESVAKNNALIVINLPRMTSFYKDEALEHLRMFSDKDIKNIFGNKKNYKFELCRDELDRETSFITYNK